MKMFVTVRKKVEVKFLDMQVAVRYGEDDMPADAPFRSGDSWGAVIDLEGGRIEGWPEGETLSIDNMKVCDQGIYSLLDADRNEIAQIDGYVPNRLLPGSHGDYLSLEIDGAGKITNWLKNASLSDFEEDE